MKIKGINLEWYAMRWDINNRKIEKINVLYGIKEKIAKEVRKKRIRSREDLRFWLKQELMIRYWSKAEMEIAVGGIFSEYPDEFRKVDVWEQLEPNLEIIVGYIVEEMKLWE